MSVKSIEVKKLELFYESERSKIYRGSSAAGDLILLKDDITGEKSRLYNEASLTEKVAYQNLDPQILIYQGKPVIVRKFIPGKSLNKLIPPEGLDLRTFLIFAIQLGKELERVHGYGLLHNDVNPKNFIINLKSKAATLIDFEFASSMSSQKLTYDSKLSIAGTVDYISPEQTGRMNRKTDQRSDLYGLGATFYEMLTGKPPFENKDFVGLIHAHLAISPSAPSKKKRDLPAAIDHILLKLLAKNAEDRYQSIAGLLKDLEFCLENQNSPELDGFIPGKMDISSKLLVSQRLFGRKKEIAALEAAFEKASQFEKVLCLVSGTSGVGKSEVCKELYKKMSLSQSLFLSGSFDVMDRKSPYLGFEKAFNQFSDWLITSDAETQKSWKKILDKYLSGFGQTLIDLAPKLRHTLGEQPQLLPLSGIENQQRIQFAVNLFLEAISSTNQTLVIFLDDLQWANDASIELLEAILKNENLKNILILGTYRSNEVREDHFLNKTLRKFKSNESKSFHLSELTIAPIHREDVAKLISETLKIDLDGENELVNLIYTKTQGNPFAINKLLESLYSRKLLKFDLESGEWTWNLHELEKENLSENILDILLTKLDSYSAETLKLIKMASVFGLQFSLKQLALISSAGSAMIQHGLWPLIQDGSLMPMANDYRFLPEFYETEGRDVLFKFAHARIQQAVYSLLSAEERERLHFQIGEVFLREFTEDELEKRSIEIAVHFLLGKNYLSQSERKSEIGRLLLKAGENSSHSAAFESALNFDLLGLELLRGRLSQEKQFKIHLQALENAHLSRKVEMLPAMEADSLAIAKDLSQRLLVYEVIVRCLTIQNSPNQAIVKTQKALEEAGVKVPKQASIPEVLFHLLKMAVKLPASKTGSLSQLPRAQDPTFLALSKLLYASFPSYLFSNPQTYPLVILKMLELTLRHGLAPSSVTGIASYGLILITAMKQAKNGYAVIQKALQLVERDDMRAYTATVYMVYVAFAAYLQNTPKAYYKYFLEGYEKGLLFGNMEYAGWNIFFKATLSFHEGKHLPECLDEIRKARRFTRQYNLENQYTMIAILETAAEIMAAEQHQVEKKLDEWFHNPSPELKKAVEEKNDVFLYTHFGDCGNVLLWFAQYEKAATAYENFYKHCKNQPVGFFTVYEKINRAINAACLVKKSGVWEYEGVNLRKIVKAQLGELKSLASQNPDGFDPFYQFLLNFYKALNQKNYSTQAMEKAIADVQREEMNRYVVLFSEIYSDLSTDAGAKETYSNAAIQAARKMSATSKVEMLLGLKPTSPSNKTPERLEKIASQSSSFEISSIDTMTLIKSMDALIGEIKLEPLLQKLLTYAMENSGAQEGHFLVNGAKGWTLEVSTRAADMSTDFPKVMLAETSEISHSVINYAKGTKESLLIRDALHTSPYSADPVIRSKSIRSVLCIPFINQSKNSGIIYLTHSGTPDAFQKEHINLMRLMAGQIAGIIENALLYKNMEDLVAERTAQLEDEKKKSDALLLNILPKEIADELIQQGQADARHHDQVSVMFVDIKDFTAIAETMAPRDLVKNLHTFFGKFDAIMEEFGLEKIKTIGDAYMAAGGVPSPTEDHPLKIVRAARKILAETEEINQLKKLAGEATFDIRIGIHVGPVVAGVVGNKKFAYDIWGDTVNIASRMESNSLPGKINISEDLYQLIKGHFDCEYRGEVDVKNKGMMNMYFVNHPLGAEV
ncbi:adenylate/guanylate cyclase domain-containing protein [Algoriphagus namhaensis]